MASYSRQQPGTNRRRLWNRLGGVLVHNNNVKIVSGQWDSEIESSVESEPKGTLAALKSANIRASDIIIVTDHEPLIYAAQSQQAHGWFYYSAGMGASWALLNPTRDIPGLLVSSSFDANQLPLSPSILVT